MRKPEWLIGRALERAGVPHAHELAMMLAKSKIAIDIPAIPETVSMYLYGTPAKQTVTYNGVELPDIESVWDKSKYPYAVIDFLGEDFYVLIFTNEEPTFNNGVGEISSTAERWVSIAILNQELADALGCELNTWQEPEHAEDAVDNSVGGAETIWSNFDILNADGGKVTYNGVELPDIEAVWTDKETYPYAVILKADEYALVLHSVQLYGDKNGNIEGVGTNSADNALVYGLDTATNEWLFETEYDLAGFPILASPVWTSHDIISYDDNSVVYLSASEPVKSSSVYLAASEPVYTYPDANIGLRVAGDKVKYGGVELPNIESVWDKTKYPYAFVQCVSADDSMGTYMLTALSDGLIYDVTESGKQRLTNRTACQMCAYLIVVTGSNFDEMLKQEGITREEAEALFGVTFDVWNVQQDNYELVAEQFNLYLSDYDELVWSSFDILNADGTIYLAASEPEPVATVTYYDGAVAAAYPELDSVPYVAIVKTSKQDCVADYSSCPIVWSSEGNLSLGETGTNRMYMVNVFKDGVWTDREPLEPPTGVGYPTDYEKILWANHDIKNHVGTKVEFAKSPDPIPVSGIVGYKYGDKVLPDIQTVWDKEKYPYVAIQMGDYSGQFDITNGVVAFATFSNKPLTIGSNFDTDYCLRGWTESQDVIDTFAGVYDFKYNEWAVLEEETAGRVNYNDDEYPMWANYDVLNADGSVYLAASDPIPVYERGVSTS